MCIRDSFIDAFNPRTTAEGLSSGRFPDGADNRIVFEEATPVRANRHNPRADIVINEIMYNPADDAGGEYIELLNRSGEAVNLSGWAFTRGIDFEFPNGTSIGPGEYLVLAREPLLTQKHYGLGNVLGPWEGGLSNSAETLLLRDPNGNPADRVRYADEGSYPETPDGEGPSLELINPGIETATGPPGGQAKSRARRGASTPAHNPTPTRLLPAYAITRSCRPQLKAFAYWPPFPTSASSPG